MKVLLCEDIKKLGYCGDIVEVATGYARNYLFPQRLAKTATENNVRAIAKEKARRAEERIQERQRLEAAARAVENAEAVLAAKANEQGVLFGSITEKDIATNLRDQGFQVADHVVHLPAHLKQTGTHSVELRFAEDLRVAISVVVVAEQTGPTAEGLEGTQEENQTEGPVSQEA